MVPLSRLHSITVKLEELKCPDDIPAELERPSERRCSTGRRQQVAKYPRSSAYTCVLLTLDRKWFCDIRTTSPPPRRPNPPAPCDSQPPDLNQAAAVIHLCWQEVRGHVSCRTPIIPQAKSALCLSALKQRDAHSLRTVQRCGLKGMCVHTHTRRGWCGRPRGRVTGSVGRSHSGRVHGCGAVCLLWLIKRNTHIKFTLSGS